MSRRDDRDDDRDDDRGDGLANGLASETANDAAKQGARMTASKIETFRMIGTRGWRALTAPAVGVALLCGAGCKGGDKMESSGAVASAPGQALADREMAPAAPAAAMAEEASSLERQAPGRLRNAKMVAGEDGILGSLGDGPADADENDRGGGGQKKGGRGASGEQSTRAWFPETFLFKPLIVTDDQGAATVSTRVPDRLTSWRVLALAHSRSGAQGGAVASFLGTLPTYVDPVVPPQLVAGDEVRVPIQVVNTTASAVSTRLTVAAKGGTVVLAGAAAGALTVPAGGSRVEYVRLQAPSAGKLSLEVALDGGDAVRRTIDVVSPGRPIVTTRSGTLAAPRTLTLAGVPGADAASDRVSLRAYPGALALLRSELGVATARSGVADNAYALLLAGRGAALLEALGEKADPETLRELSILAGQRALRDARTLDVASAALLAEAALAHPGNPVMQRLAARAAEYLAKNQRPDGTFAGGSGWTVQRVLVATADATRAIASATSTPEEARRAAAARVRATGAFERNAAFIEDAYTAAAVLASGAVAGPLAEKLRAQVVAAVREADSGAKVLPVGEGVVRADGATPSELEATALAVLALQGHAGAPLADLGASVLGGYDFLRGWGDGAANLVALRAVLELFANPLPDRIAIKLLRDGQLVAEQTLTKELLRGAVTLEALSPGLAAAHQWQIVAEPAVPGLGFSLSLHSWVPWPRPVPGGVELQLPERVSGSVGQPISLTLSAVAPGGLPLHLQHALPAGVAADRGSLQALVDAGTITRFVLSDGRVDLYANPLPPGQVFTAQYRAVPTLAGTLQTTASLLEAGSHLIQVPPTTWTIK
jgi:Alpha-2-macroglobulin family